MDILRVILGWAAFAVFHSLTVSEGYEQLARRAMGERAFDAWHRLLFTAYSAAAFLVLVLYLRTIPDAPLYRLKGLGRLLFHAVQLCGVAFLFWTPWDLLEFVGIRQWERRRRGEPAGPEGAGRLFTGKAYGIVRHPLYLGISVVLAFHPVQTRNSLLSTAMVVLYFYVGTFFEERRMVRKFGEEYRKYREHVPRFLPLPRPNPAGADGYRIPEGKNRTDEGNRNGETGT
ncbi:MAG TPA: isoprenylcysteine carboxylmethyltransferase family protein [Candidatus Deferrimicrobiaceae bacterium]|nr:isoprenylcysteine carboxylmethyltransferase family protein [Candidatus Deferrimicrobiaceae bacterium]